MFPLKSPIVALAPMDGITDLAYRQTVRSLNKDIVLYSEFTSVNGFKHSEHVRNRLNFDDKELPYFAQIFGNEPDLFAKTVEHFDQTPVTGIDINMGCPSKKIIKSTQGGALMKDPELACRIVAACVDKTDKPVTVKTRLGWKDAENLQNFVASLIDAGAKMVTIHGRTYKQAYKGDADWDPIYELKKNCTIPILGNGDIKGKDDGLVRLKNLDGYMIGRSSIGNPWVFWSDLERAKVTLKEKVDVMINHFQLLRSYQEEKRALIEFRKHITGYICGFKDAKACRALLMQSRTEKELTQQAYSIC
ncbi:MAG: tRNA-dihydrouridine synthase [Proteobacteria bacterium]|nr:tRNA-dihydrouridine synthase [Pseudomonadota bacterium]